MWIFMYVYDICRCCVVSNTFTQQTWCIETWSPTTFLSTLTAISRFAILVRLTNSMRRQNITNSITYSCASNNSQNVRNFLIFQDKSWDLEICDLGSLFIWDMTHSHVTWLIHTWRDTFTSDMTLLVTANCNLEICDFDSLFIYVPWLFQMWRDTFTCDMTPSYVAWRIHVWHESFICDMTHFCVTCLIYMWHATIIRDIIRMWLDLFTCDPFICDMTHIYIGDMTQIYTCILMWHDSSFICDTTHSRHTILMWHDSFTCGSFIRDTTQSYVTWLIHMRHDSSICDMSRFIRDTIHPYVTWLIHIWLIHTWHDSSTYDLFIRDMTHSHVTCLSVTQTAISRSTISVSLTTATRRRRFTNSKGYKELTKDLSIYIYMCIYVYVYMCSSCIYIYRQVLCQVLCNPLSCASATAAHI